MSAPRLTRALVLEAPVAVPDGAGGQGVSWTALGTLWAAIKPGAGRERQGVLGASGEVSLRITLRAAPMDSTARPRAGQRLRDGARVFRILSVIEADPAGRYLTATAIEEEPA
ncbi:MAG: head-tail adaptor protein [Roseinatronobacter sp.]